MDLLRTTAREIEPSSNTLSEAFGSVGIESQPVLMDHPSKPGTSTGDSSDCAVSIAGWYVIRKCFAEIIRGQTKDALHSAPRSVPSVAHSKHMEESCHNTALYAMTAGLQSSIIAPDEHGW